MAWNRKTSILGFLSDGEATELAVRKEADTIFTATFIGMVIDRGRLGYRVDMEPDMDGKDEAERTNKDREAMQKHNDVCAKVNHIVRSFRPLLEDERGIHWGLTPEFSRGGLISGGEAALKGYAGYDRRFMETAWNYLTQDKDGQTPSVYIGRGAYCGLVVADDSIVTAMSTLRTMLPADSPQEYPIDAGDRWLPPKESDVFKGRLKDPGFTWGMIGTHTLQQDLLKQGMKFVPRDSSPNPDNAIVGYTHGLVRAIYECERIGEGRPYEMSLGTNTAKLASCMSCSLFMVANGYAPSASHLGAGESWLPLYHTSQHQFAPNYKPSANTAEVEQKVLSAIGAAKEAMNKAVNNKFQQFITTLESASDDPDVRKLLRKVAQKVAKKVPNAANATAEEQNKAVAWASTAAHDATLKADLIQAMRECNDRWAWKMAAWMTTGVRAMQAQPHWIAGDPDLTTLNNLARRLTNFSLKDNPKAYANLYLDAMTSHTKDLDRLDKTLKFGPGAQPGSEHQAEHALADWLVGEWRSHPWMKYGWRQFRNPFSSDYIAEFRRLPPRLQK